MSSHEEQVREVQQHMDRMRELQLHLQREARRTATPRFGPAVDGVLWSKIRPEGDADKSLKIPILSILEFPLKPGIDVRDNSKSPWKLWDAALHYISSIPGFCAVEWWATLEDPPSGVFCLIYWDSTIAWNKFQRLSGFSPLIVMLASDVSNRCAKLTGRISGAPRLGDAVRVNSVVDVVSVTFDTKDVSTPERRSFFEERWHTLVASVTGGSGDEGLQYSHAVWLENDASTFFDPSEAEAAAATVSATFTAFLAWDGANYNSNRLDHLCDGLRTSLISSGGNEPTTISRKAVRLLNQLQQQEDPHSSRQPAAPLASLASIIRMDVPRQCNAGLANLRERAPPINRSMNDARARTRLFPAPRGSFISQGELYVGSMPVIPNWWLSNRSPHGHHIVDVVWIKLKRLAASTNGPRIYKQLNNEISTLPGFIKSFWARDVENKTKFAVLTVWEDELARGAALHDYHRILDDFAASSTRLSLPLTYQTFPMPRGLAGGYFLSRVRYLELTSFYIPPGALERQLFEHAYGDFAWMTRPSQIAGIPTACTVINDSGFWQPAEATESSDYQLFTGLISWSSPAARVEWYEQLFKLSRESYELFGQPLDALKILATGGVTTEFLALQGH